MFGLAGADHDVEFPDPMPVVGTILLLDILLNLLFGATFYACS